MRPIFCTRNHLRHYIVFTMLVKVAILCICLLSFQHVVAYNKYSEGLNNPKTESELPAKDGKRTFRMQKINLLWEKASQRLLAPEKLKSLFKDLIVQDKEEIMWKKLKAEGKDKDGLKENELRRKLSAIMKKYNLDDHFPDSGFDDKDHVKLHKQIFSDKKLNKLWAKAEQIGFSDEQLKTLKEEFQHQQEKIDQYYQLMNDAEMKRSRNDVDEHSNSIETLLESESTPSKKTESAHQVLQEKHQDIKQGYQKLTSLINDDSLSSQAFEEPQVLKLWELAQKADFTKSELESLKEELKHFQHRLQKLKYLQADLDFAKNRNLGLSDKEDNGPEHLRLRVKDLSRKVEKLNTDFETRIMQRHMEL